ncbi:hypothetical protein V3J37_003828 [Salmonella enterica]
MVNFLRKTSSWVNKVTGNPTFQFIIIFIAGIMAGYQAGEQTKFYNLSKDPQASLVELIYKKCGGNEIVAKDIRGPWTTEQMTCWSEELTHASDNTFKTRCILKSVNFSMNATSKKKTKKNA